MRMFFGAMFLLGILLSVYALTEAHKVKDCSTNVQNSIRAILVMGVAMTCISFTAMICKCGGGKDPSGFLGKLFLFGILAISLTTLVLVSIIMSKCPDAKGGTTVAALLISILAILMTGGYIGYDIYFNRGAGVNPLGAASAPLAFRFYN